MAEKKIIAVVGATGAQGGGLVQAILNDDSGAFGARALTRSVESEKAKALAAQGAEVVAADLDDPDSLVQAFSGCHGAFCVTAFWEHFSPEKEMAQAENMAKAAKQAGVAHVIWSTLEDTRLKIPLSDDRMPTLQEKYKVPHFDGKGEANAKFMETGVPTTLLHTSFYWDNFIHFGMGPKKGEDGKLALNMPVEDKKLPGMAAQDIGACAFGLFQRGDEFAGKTVGIAGEHLTGSEMASRFSEALGEEVVYNAVPFDMYRSFDFPGADDLGNMFQYKCDFEAEFCGLRDVEFSRSLHPGLLDLAGWLAQYRDQISTE